MPDITITPGTFNPPAPLAVVHGYLDFPKTPFQQVKRPAMQFQSRHVAEEEVPVELGLDVEYTIWDPYLFAAVGPKETTASEIAVTGARYVPDGKYLVNGGSGGDDFYTSNLADRQPYGDRVALDDTPGYWISGWNEYGPNPSVKEMVTFNIRSEYLISITLVGCNDGAEYAVTALVDFVTGYDPDATPPYNPVPMTNAGGGVWTLPVSYKTYVDLSGDERFGPTIPVNLNRRGTFTLYRNGMVYDKLVCFSGQTTLLVFGEEIPRDENGFPAGVEGFDYQNVDGPTLPDIHLKLYGPNASEADLGALAVVPDVNALVLWSRASYATQGKMVLNPTT